MEGKTKERKVSDEMGKREPNVFERINLIYGCTLELFHYKVVFFTCYGAFACLYTFIPLYFKQLGLSAFQTGVLTGLRPLCQAIGAPFWGIIADRFKRRKIILFLGSTAWLIKNMLIFLIRPTYHECFAKPVTHENESSIGRNDASVASSTLSTPTTSPPFDKYKYFIQVDNAELSDIFYSFLLLVLVGELFGSIVHPLLDGCTVDYLGDERKVYGRIRLWGSVGMVLANFLAGLIINHYTYQYCGEIRKHYIIAFYIFAAFMVIMLIELFFVKIVYSDKPKETLRDIKNLFNSRLKLCFWLVAIAFGTSDGFQADFNSWFLDDLKATSFQVHIARNFSKVQFPIPSVLTVGYDRTIRGRSGG